MTTWKERGYVPASDGEDSEEELETQEEVRLPTQQENPVASPEPGRPEVLRECGDIQKLDGKPTSDALPALPVPDDEIVDPGVAQEKDVGTDRPIGLAKRGEEKRGYVPDDESMDMDEVMLVAEKPSGAAQGIPTENPAVTHTDNAATNQRIDEDGDGRVAGLQNFNVGQRTRTRTPNRTADDSNRFSSPDPITGEPQLRSQSTPPRVPKPSHVARHTTPPQIPHATPVEPSSATSSPLSSVPPSPIRTVTPPSSIHPASRLGPPPPINGFQVVVNNGTLLPSSPILSTAPVIEETSPFFQRSLRQRKPIQVHPYILEDARYKQQMKAKGVQPIRIRQEESPRGTTGGDKDSQDTEYVAPPSPEARPPKEPRTKGSSVDGGVRNEFADAVRRPEPQHIRQVSKDGSKRRKIQHTYGRKPSNLNSSASGPSRTNQGRPSLTRTSEAEIYDLPNFRDSPSPPSRPPLRRRTSNTALPSPAVISEPRMTKDEMAALLRYDFSSDSDLDATPKPPAAVGNPRSRAISISSNESSRRRRDSLGSQNTGGSESDLAAEDSSQEKGGGGKTVKWFKKRGTRGVLPASYIRFTEGSKPESRRPEKTVISLPPDERRPGIARAKISSRPREPIQDSFLDDAGGSDSSDDMVLFASGPVKKRQAKQPTSSGHQRQIVLIDDDGDIPEDNRIDYGLPARRREATATKSRRKAGTTGHGRTATGQGPRRQGSTALRKRNPRNPSGPKLSVVDAAAHLRQSGNGSTPRFLKVAARSALARKDKGRQSPARKLFVLDTAEDTREVQAVLRNWWEGTLPFGRRDPPPRHDSPPLPTQGRLASPPRFEDEQQPKPKRRVPTFSRAAKPRQTSLLHHDFQKQPQSGRAQPNKPRSVRPLAVVSSQKGYVTHRPAFAPQFAQFERDVPSTRQPSRQHPTSLAIENVIQNIHQQRTQQRASRDLQASSVRKAGQSLAKANALALQTPPPSSAPTAQPSPAPRRPAPRRKKITPRRIDADTIERRQPPSQDLIVDDGDLFEPMIVEDQVVKDCLSGLLPFGSKYSLNFDTASLKDGTIFNSSTFIGKGCLTLALHTQCPRTSAPRERECCFFGDTTLYWGIYDDTVATEFEKVLGMIGDAAEKQLGRSDADVMVETEAGVMSMPQAYEFYCYVVKYINKTLSFHDPLDAVSFAQRFLQSIKNCCSRLSLPVSGPSDTTASSHDHTRLVLQANTFLLVIAFQIFRLFSHDVDTQEQLELANTLRKIGRELLSRLLRCGIDRIRACYEDQRRRIQFERGITSDHYIVELWVLVIHILDNVSVAGISFWNILNEELHMQRVESSVDVRYFERLWRSLFTLLPLHQFDEFGVSRRIDDHHPGKDNWALVKVLAGRPLRIYDSNKAGHSTMINDYLRVIYARCYHLITKWSWINPDSIIPVLFEFFASNGLANLSNEQDKGSPDFLLNLDKNPTITVNDSDCCFHLLLKTIVVGLQRMRTTSTSRKINGLVYRLMPNHRRQYPKDEALHLEHLDALKNHHYLLEALHWAAPPDCRPPLDAIRLLVDPETSHRQACNVAVRAWTNLIRFQLHSEESLKPLKQLMEWFDDLTIKTLGQHQLVRSEAERQFRVARENQDSNLSEEDMEENIRRNQKQLEEILNDLVKSLCIELATIPGNIPGAVALLTSAATASILNSYTRLSNRLLLEVLGLLQHFLKTCKPTDKAESSHAPVTVVASGDEDSQDYGDWSGFEEVVLQDETKQAAEHFLTVAYDPLHRMLSNCFGADIQPEETLLMKIVDTWALTAGFLVQYGLKTWDGYLEYSRESWSSLRDTAQTRKFTAYFLPKIIRSESDIYHSNKSSILSSWMRSLVERESMLKFQNEFTATLLDCDSENPLLSNPPFEKDSTTGLFKISPTEFRSRRLALISSVLEHMRETYKAASGRAATALKQEYAEMLRAMMKAMRDNFEALQSSTVAGKYVDFVHKVVELLLQYAPDIVEIDRFFTDSTAFPLPAMDPNYVVGQLKKYVFGLSFPGTQKQLNAFFQTLGERAALGHEQNNLVTQLSTALSEDFELGDTAKPTMRAYFLHAIFPAYIETALEHPAGWILGVPVLRALCQVIQNLKVNIDSTSYGSIQSVISMFATVLDSMRRAASQSMTTNDAFSTRHIIGTLFLLLKALTHALPLVSWFYEDADESLRATVKDCSDFLIRFAAYARKMVTRRHDDEAQRPLDVLAMSDRPHSAFEAGRKHAKDTLRAYLAARWVSGGNGTWSINDPGTSGGRRPVSLPEYPGEMGTEEQAREEFVKMVEELTCVAARTHVFGRVVKELDVDVWSIEGRGLPWRERAHGKSLKFLGRLFV